MVPCHDTAARRGAPRADAAQTGMALLDVVVAAALLLIILVPAAAILATSGKVVTNAKAQAVAGSLATSQLAQDRASWTSTSSAPTYSSSSCGSGYSSSSVNATYHLYLASCPAVGGENYWVFQNGGWCVNGTGNTLASSTTGTDIEPLYWVEVMVDWGGNTPPSPSTVVAHENDIVMSSALQTPNGYGGTTPGSCPL